MTEQEIRDMLKADGWGDSRIERFFIDSEHAKKSIGNIEPPVWTKINGPETWPENDWDDVVWYSDEDNSHAMGPIPFVDVERFTHWRPLCGLDFPPKNME